MRRLAMVICATLFPLSAVAQPHGDWNGDGAVDGADFAEFETCMSGPAASASPTCAAAFDAVSSGTVDLADFMAFQPVVAPANACTAISRRYAGFEQSESALTGIRATISTLLPGLCSPPPALVSAVFVWTGVTKIVGNQVSKWAQLGYARGARFPTTGPFAVPPPNPGTWYRTYIEFQDNAGSTAGYVRIFFDPPPVGNLRYTCRVSNFASGFWTFQAIDDFGLPFFGTSITGPGGVPTAWANDTGNRADFFAEMFTVHDRAPGSGASPCSYLECETQQTLGPFQPTSFLTAVRRASTAFEGAAVVGEDTFDLWDTRN